MKARIIILVLLVCTGTLLAGLIGYDASKPPRLPLGAAYNIATKAMGQSTNQFYCIGARLLISYSPDGEWVFDFSSTNGVSKRVTVEFDGKTHIDSPYRPY